MQSDLISRSRLLRDPYFQEDRYPESHLLRIAICAAPAVDAVKVVRCVDCKWLYDGKDMYCCTKHTGLALIKHDGSSFCSYGERRTDDGH